MCHAKVNTDSEELHIKILPYNPDILCPISVCLDTCTDSCNHMSNKLSLRKYIQAKSKYLSMEAFVPSLEQVLRANRNNAFCVNSKMPLARERASLITPAN